MNTSINKVMLLGVLAMMLTSGSIATANEDGSTGGYDARSHMEEGMEAREKGNRGERGDKQDHGDYEEKKAALETAIMNNDFAAYQAQVSAQYEEKMAEKEEYCAENADAEKCNDDHDNQEDKGADLQEKFDTARAYYEENGELPQNKRANYTKRGSGKHFKAAHAGIVSKMIKTVDAGRLEKALAKIDARIGSIDDEVVLDLLEGIRDSIIEVLDAQA